MYALSFSLRHLLIGCLALFTWTQNTVWCTAKNDEVHSQNITNIFTGKVYLLVAGATGGIGNQITQTFAQLLDEKSKVLLLAGNVKKLQQAVEALPKSLDASYKSIDFSKTSTEELQDIIKESLKNEKPESFDQAIIVHAAAGAKYDQLTTDMTDFEEWHGSFELNMFSPAILNNIFVKTFSEKSVEKYVINLSSYWGLSADVYLGSFCPARAAKDMYFKVIALENPAVNVLNYLPGFVGTNMYYDALKNSKNEALKAQLQDFIDHKKFITPAQTVDCLVKVLRQQNYKSGDYVDYFKSPSECMTCIDFYTEMNVYNTIFQNN